MGRVRRGYVLAGGRSSRMGRDKALIPVDGVPLAARIADVLAAAGLDVYLIRRGHPADPRAHPPSITPERRVSISDEKNKEFRK